MSRFAVRRAAIAVALTAVFLMALPVKAEDVAKAPPAFRAALFLKLLGFNKAVKGDVSLYVVGDDAFAAEMKKAVGKPLGAGKLTSVLTGAGVPSAKPSIIYCGSAAKVDEVIAYSRAQKILSISGEPAFSPLGITLVVGVLANKPKILLNVSSSKEEGIDWNPAILKISTVSK